MLEAPLLCRLLWGIFLAETRKVQLIDKYQFEAHCFVSGRHVRYHIIQSHELSADTARETPIYPFGMVIVSTISSSVSLLSDTARMPED